VDYVLRWCYGRSVTDEATGFSDTKASYEKISRAMEVLRSGRDALIDAFGDNIVEYHGVDVTFRDAVDLERDQFLYGTAYVLIEGTIGRRLPPEHVVLIHRPKEAP
jgi:hypothetical protein